MKCQFYLINSLQFLSIYVLGFHGYYLSVVAHLHSGISKTSITRSFERELASALKRFFQPEVLGDRC